MKLNWHRSPEGALPLMILDPDAQDSNGVLDFEAQLSAKLGVRSMVGILVHGDNHFIVRGPLPEDEMAFALVRHWSLIQIGTPTPASLTPWNIVSREFRENLEWAMIVPGDGATSPAVTVLLDELSARGIRTRDLRARGNRPDPR
jgi:hypothetical protein